VNRGNGLAGPRVAAGTVKAVRRTVAAEEGMETTASVQPLGTAADDDLTLGLLDLAAGERDRVAADVDQGPEPLRLLARPRVGLRAASFRSPAARRTLPRQKSPDGTITSAS
jgi:hypothetical protein